MVLPGLGSCGHLIREDHTEALNSRRSEISIQNRRRTKGFLQSYRSEIERRFLMNDQKLTCERFLALRLCFVKSSHESAATTLSVFVFPSSNHVKQVVVSLQSVETTQYAFDCIILRLYFWLLVDLDPLFHSLAPHHLILNHIERGPYTRN